MPCRTRPGTIPPKRRIQFRRPSSEYTKWKALDRNVDAGNDGGLHPAAKAGVMRGVERHESISVGSGDSSPNAARSSHGSCTLQEPNEMANPSRASSMSSRETS